MTVFLAEVIPGSQIGIADVRQAIKRSTGMDVPRSTLNRWKKFLGIKPRRVSQRRQFYEQRDIDWLVTLANWLLSGRTFAEFEERYENQNTNTTEG
jgi:DNA-binding transcriptional MerR regulator